MRSMRYLILLLALVLVAPSVWAQQAQLGPGTPVTQTGSTGQAATACSSSTLASGQQTLTLVNPGPNLSYYLTTIGIWGVATGATTGATPTLATMTGIAGTSPSLMPLASVYPAVGAQGSVSGGYVPLISPIKSLAGTAVTIVGPSAITGLNQQIMACYYIAP